MNQIDLNCDVGEGTGNDQALMPFITSCSIACGGHYGDQKTVLQTLRYAEAFAVNTGAHPSYNDPENFGRKSLALPLDQLQESLRKQLDLFYGMCKKVSHIKPHGALYNDLFDDVEKAEAVVEVFTEYDPAVKLFCSPKSALSLMAKKAGLIPLFEGFGDRAYNSNGGLVSRNNAQAVFYQKEKIAEQVLSIIQQQQVMGINGEEIPLDVQTICLHGDGKNIKENLAYLVKTLAKNNIDVKAV